VFIAFNHPRITRCILQKGGIAAHVTRRCVGSLIVNKLAAGINALTFLVNDAELTCLSAILGTDSKVVSDWLNHPGAIQFANIVFLLDDVYDGDSRSRTSDVLDVVRQTFRILFRSLPAQYHAEMRLDLTVFETEVSKSWCEMHTMILVNSLMMYPRELFSFPCRMQQTYRHVSEELVEFNNIVHRTRGLDYISILRARRIHPPKDHSLHT
jgi:hypothetical protein